MVEEKHTLSRAVSGSEQQLSGGVCLNLSAFVDKYSSHYLPRAVQIRKGSVHSRHIDLSEGSIITIYAAAKSDMVSMQDSKGMVYAIPLDATSEFGLVGDKPYNQTGQTVEYRTAGDLAASLATPKLVCALKSWGDDPKSSVEAGEVLIVVNASAKHLDLYSITTLSKKSVPAKCAGRFTTAPTSIKLPLFKLLHYFPDILPVRVIAFPDVYCSELPSELDLSEVTLLQRHEKGNIIASYSKQQEKVVFSLPITTPLDIYIMPYYDHKFIPPVYEYEKEEKVKKSLQSSDSKAKEFSATSLLSFPQAPSQAGPAGADMVDAASKYRHDRPRHVLSLTKKGEIPQVPLSPPAGVNAGTFDFNGSFSAGSASSSGANTPSTTVADVTPRYNYPRNSLIRTKKGESPGASLSPSARAPLLPSASAPLPPSARAPLPPSARAPLPPSAGAADRGKLNGLSSARGNEYTNIDIPDSTGMAVRKANIEYLSSLDDAKVGCICFVCSSLMGRIWCSPNGEFIDYCIYM